MLCFCTFQKCSDLQFEAELLSLRIDLGKEDKCNNACKQHPSKSSCSLILELHNSCTRTRALDKSSVRLEIKTLYNVLCDVGMEDNSALRGSAAFVREGLRRLGKYSLLGKDVRSKGKSSFTPTAQRRFFCKISGSA